MKILGISGSPRRDGNTDTAVKLALDCLAKEGFETEFVSVADHPVKPCIACGGCKKAQNRQCVMKDPAFDGMVEKFVESDGIIVASPVYFGSATPQIMSVLDRVGYVSRANGNLLRRKVGAAIAVGRRAGMNFTFAQLNFFFLLAEMIVPGSTYWNVSLARDKGDFPEDAEGVATVENLAANMAWTLEKLS